MDNKIRVAILGASGYTGAELIRLLRGHPHIEIRALSGDAQAGSHLSEVFPHLAGWGNDPVLEKIDAIDFEAIDLVFCALPHGTTQAVVRELPGHLRIIDLSADFRLADPEVYAEWYGHPHGALALQEEAVYGLTEHARDQIARARLIANPGCYPTASLLPLLPLMKDGLVDPQGIIIDAKSGVSGAGRGVKRELLYNEIDGGMSAYSVSRHRHQPEIDQALSLAAGEPVEVTFTPHLIPMPRGMIATIYFRLKNSKTIGDVRASILHSYQNELFIELLDSQRFPNTHAVKASNRCQIGVYPGRAMNEVIMISAIDNLVKGASGQAVQNMNVMYGWRESLGLEGLPIFP